MKSLVRQKQKRYITDNDFCEKKKLRARISFTYCTTLALLCRTRYIHRYSRVRNKRRGSLIHFQKILKKKKIEK